MAVTSLARSAAACDAFHDIPPPLTQPAMALNIDLLLVLAMEQHQALITVNRCSSEITRLLSEEQQRNKAAQAVERRNDEIEPTPSPWPARLVPQSTATKRPRHEASPSATWAPIESSDEELTDEALLQAGLQHELSSAQPAQIPPPSEVGAAAALRIAGAALQLIASWSTPEVPKHEHERPTHSPPPTVLGATAAQGTATHRPPQPASWSAPEHPKH